MEQLTIEEISVTKKGRYALFAQGQFLFSVDEETLVREKIKEGLSLSVARLEELRQTSETRKACDKALDYLSRRDHSSGELYEKLCRRYDPQSSAAAVAKMQELDLVDDLAFARHRARYLMNQHKSRNQILQALAQKGIDRQMAGMVLEELWDQEENDPDREALDHLIRRSYLQKLAQGKTQQVAAALCRRGFSPGLVRSLIQEYTNQESEYYEE